MITMNRRGFLHGAGTLSLAAATGGLTVGSAAAVNAVRLVGWTFRPDMVQAYIDLFNRTHDGKVDYSTLPWPQFHATLEQRFFAEDIIDVMYCTHDFRQRWFERGMIRALDDLPGFEAIKDAMMASGLESLSSKDGQHVIGLPYHTAYFIMMYNEPMLQAASLEPAAGWDELVEQCVKLKTEGASEYPFLPNWSPSPTGTNLQFLTDCFAEGASLFDQDNRLQADQDEIAHVMERWQKVYELGLVSPELLTKASSPEVNMMMFTGNYAYQSNHCYLLQSTATDEAQSRLAGRKAKMMPYPGKTGDTYAWTDSYVLNAKSEALEDAWKLMQFVGANLNGDWYVQKQWAIASGLQQPYPQFYEDAEVASSTESWVDPDILQAQARKGKVIGAYKEAWYPEYATKSVPILHDMIRARRTVPDAIRALDELYRSLA